MTTEPTSNRIVAVGLSGGIDSSVAAHLLAQQGYQVIGLTMQTWDGSIPLTGSGHAGCYGPGEAEDIESARKIAAQLGIPHFVIPLADEYKAEVLEYFRQEYLAGRTPNPCVRCNHRIKFGLLLERARAHGVQFDLFATGHYARVSHDAATGRHLLLRGRDARKDQSYFLSHLTQEQLARLVLPLGDLNKDDVRKIAADLGWQHLLDKPESQDFIECDSYGVLFRQGDAKPGPIVNEQGQEIGRHEGIIHYTVGQRRGLRIGGSPHPLYVTAVNSQDNTVRVGGKEHLYGNRLLARDVNWIAFDVPPSESLRAMVKVRQQHQAAAATLRMIEQMSHAAGPDAQSPRSGDPDTNQDQRTAVEVTFDVPQLAITPGQTAVFYDGDTVLGAGTIT